MTVHTADGRQWRRNIATECRQPEAAWPEMLTRPVRIIGAMDTASDGMTREDKLAVLYPRWTAEGDLPPDFHGPVVAAQPGDEPVLMVAEDHFFVATYAAILPELLETLGEDARSPHGWVVGLPFRHMLLFHRVSGDGRGAS